MPSSPQQEELGQLLLTEVLTLALGREYTYALYEPLEGFADAWIRQELHLQGFLPVPEGVSRSALAVDMRQPIILSNNVGTTIKPPLSTAPMVVAAVAAAHRRLQEAMTKLQPGSLVLAERGTNSPLISSARPPAFCRTKAASSALPRREKRCCGSMQQ